MDHFGPFELNKRSKKWGLIFICLTTRAVHIEDVNGPGAEPFCHALDRFIQRRCMTPTTLRSDRGTAFVNLAAQQNKTAEVYAEEIRLLTLKKWRIDLVFNPPGAPHWGGSWERTIKEIKKIVVAAFAHSGCKTWTADDLRTYLVRAEGILNRRPIAFGDDGEIITPAKFLHPSSDVDVGPARGDPKISSLAAIRTAEKALWDKWVKYYLPSMSAKQVLGEIHYDTLQPGDNVLLREGSNPLVESWTPAVIKEVFPSPDGIVRSVMVTVNGSDLVRDVTRISVLDGPVLRRRGAIGAPRGVSGLPGPTVPPEPSTGDEGVIAPSLPQGGAQERAPPSTDDPPPTEDGEEKAPLKAGAKRLREQPSSTSGVHPALSPRDPIETRGYKRARAAEDLVTRQLADAE
jgi:hypothetical protein